MCTWRRATGRVGAAVAIGAFAAWADAQEHDGGVAGEFICPGEGSCYEANGTPGCEEEACCTIVCAKDAFCCTTAWDQICADAAVLACVGACCGPGGSCAVVTGADCVDGGGSYQGTGTSCPDDCVGACCYEDRSCALLSELDCLKSGGVFEGNGTVCVEPVGPIFLQSNPEIAVPDSAPAGVSDSIFSGGPSNLVVMDLNVRLTVMHTFVGDLCVVLEHGGTSVELIQRPGADNGSGTCHFGSPFGCGQDNYVNIALDDEGGGGPIEAACALGLTSPPGYTPFEPLAAFDGTTVAGEWTLTVSDNAGGDIGTFVSWALEIQAGTAVCDRCPGQGNCFVPNGTPGCQDEACCDTVCAKDPFCCNVEWDSICVHEAVELCGNVACPGTGGCLVATGGLGCADPVCCNAVCSVDPFCCDAAWDSICVDGAEKLCTFCTGDIDGSGAVAVDDLVFVILDWGCVGDCFGDVDGDGDTDVDDLISGVILNWGPCLPFS